MKKILTICLVVVLGAATVSAKEYKYSLGVVGGLGLGAQFKTMVTDNFTIIEEFGYFTCISNAAYAGAIDNLVLAYQTKPLASGQGIDLKVYTGGQIKLGYSGNAGFDAGLFGFGAVAGIEANMKNAPIAFSFDFRPGYAFQFNGGGAGAHMFDYSFNLGVRYTF